MPALKLLNETTTVPAETSAAEITRELVTAGATQVATQYRLGKIYGLSWSMMIDGREAHFAMPARVEGVYKVLAARQKGFFSEQRKAELLDRAHRIAWRHLYRWTQAQVAMIRTSMMAPAEPFLAFVTVPGSDQTLFQAFVASRALPAGKPQ